MLKRAMVLVGLAVCLCATPAAAQTPARLAQVRSHDLAAQLKLILNWWPGQFDNHEQIVRQSGGGLSPLTYTPFHRLHSYVRAVTAPALGEHVLSVIDYANGDIRTPVRAELDVLTIDAAALAIRVTRYADPAATKLGDPAREGSLKASDLRSLGPGCDLLLRYVGGQFEGGLASKACPAPVGYAEYGIVVGPRYVWVRDQGHDPKTGAVVWEMAPGAGYDWFEESRARPFTCNVFENAQGEMAKTRYLTTVHLDDQGGESDIAWPDGRTLTFTIHNRAFSASPDREYPLFRIHEKGKAVPIAYAYAADDAKRFGLNLGWFYIRCYDDKDMDPNDVLENVKK